MGVETSVEHGGAGASFTSAILVIEGKVHSHMDISLTENTLLTRFFTDRARESRHRSFSYVRCSQHIS